jgi:hypothetical protein
MTTVTAAAASPPATGSRLSSRRGLLILLLLCGAQFLVVLDATIVNVALPSIQRAPPRHRLPRHRLPRHRLPRHTPTPTADASIAPERRKAARVSLRRSGRAPAAGLDRS